MASDRFEWRDRRVWILRRIGGQNLEMLLDFFFDWIRSPDFHVRFRWRPDSVVLWDNRCTQHDAVADDTERRIMHRVQLAGDGAPSA